MLVVPVPLANERPPLQGVSGMEDAAEDSVGGGAEGDWEVEEPVEDPGPFGRWAVQSGGAGLPFVHGCSKASATWGRETRGSEALEWELRGSQERDEEREAEAEELGAEVGTGEKLPLFLPTPSFMASADEE